MVCASQRTIFVNLRFGLISMEGLDKNNKETVTIFLINTIVRKYSCLTKRSTVMFPEENQRDN